MFLIIKDNNQLIKKEIKNKYSYKDIHFYLKNDKFYISLSNNLFFSDGSKVSVLECKKYSIYQEDIYYDLDIYVYENSRGINDFKLYQQQNLIIANDARANVLCSDPYFKGHYFVLKDKKLISNFDIIVNNKKYYNEELKDSDVIEFLGIKIIYNKDFIYMNSFNCENKLLELKNEGNIIDYSNETIKIKSYIKKDLHELTIDDIKEFKTIKEKNSFDFIKAIIPGLVMSASIFALSSINYINNPNTDLITYLITPISMFLSGVILPLIFYIVEKCKTNRKIREDINDYLDYLDEYENNLIDKIDKYILEKSECFFDYDINKIFYLNDKHEEFLCLSLGYINENKTINFKYSDNKIIDDKLNKIKERINNIDNYPLYLDLKNKKVVSIVSSVGLILRLFKHYLLEICFKHHYEDVKVAVYSLNNDLIDEIYNLPHLYFNNKRLTLNCENQLLMLDQLKLDRPLILFIFEKIYFKFSNPNIHVLYFSSDNNDIYKGSDCIVEFYSSSANLYCGKKINFKYIEYDVNHQKYFKYLSNIVNRNTKDISYNFLDIFTNSIEYNYLNADRYLLAEFAYDGNEIVGLDLHESKLGPHGLIGGSTGSGKSELIVSMLLSLCIRYSPEYLNIVLIDYKGSGLQESLSYDNKAIPHIIASVSNLDNNVLQRLIISLNNECKKRQALFKQLSNLANLSIMNIDDYLDNNNYNLENIAHELIVVDEFAELKKEHPEQIKELISLSRIGRSLGIHLILATQKPSGVIDDEIWSNSHFKIALKVFEEKDSMDLIKSKDAAYLNTVGQFLLQVDDSLIKARSIYAKSDINNNEPYKVSLLDNNLNVIKSISKKTDNLLSNAQYFVREINKTCEKLKIKNKSLEFMPHSPINRKTFNINDKFVFGESDDYLNNVYKPIEYDLNTNILVCSNIDKQINFILNTLNENKIKTVIISNKIYSGKYISDSLLYIDSEDINYLFEYVLNNENLNICIVIEDVSCLLSYDDNYLDYLCKILRRSANLKVNIIAYTHNSLLNIKLINCFEKIILINMYDQNDISNLYGCRSDYVGNSYYYDAKPISFIPIELEEYQNTDSIVEKIIKTIPENINSEIKNNKLLLGYDVKTKEKVYADKDVLVVSADKELLDIYSSAYPNLKIEEYSYSSNIKLKKKTLWLGPNIFSQRLFFPSLKNDLQYNQAYYIEGNKKYILRSINNV